MSEYNIQQKKQFILVYLTDFFPFSDPDFGDTSKFFSPQTSVCFNLFTKGPGAKNDTTAPGPLVV